jgi:hypothetical protein
MEAKTNNERRDRGAKCDMRILSMRLEAYFLVTNQTSFTRK